MKKYLILLSSIFFGISVFGQWIPHNSGTQQYIFAAQMVNGTSGYFTGLDVTSSTSSAGTSWSNVSNTYLPLLVGNDLHFFSPSAGLVCGDNDVANDQEIWYTTNGGSSWTNVYTSTSATFSVGVRMSFPSSTTGYAIIGAGEVLQTTNGGLSWSVVANLNRYLNGISFTSPSVGYISADSVLLKTTNSGATWSVVYTDPAGLSGIYFLNDTMAYAASSGVIKTTNSGLSWTRTLVPGTSPYGFCFVNTDTGYASDQSNYYGDVLRTVNGGQSWERQYINIPGASFKAVSFSGGTGLAVGTYGALATTTNYGGGPGKPFSVFGKTSALCDTVLTFTNYSFAGDQSKWYFNRQYVSNSYNYSHPVQYGNGNDTIALVVSNGTYSDTSSLVVPRIVLPVLPNLATVHFSADTICAGSYFCVNIDTSSLANTYTMTSNGSSVYSFTGVSTGIGHCINNIQDSTRVVVTISNSGTCKTLSDSIVREVQVPVATYARITLLDSIICPNSTFRVRLDNTSPWFRYFLPGDTVTGAAGSVSLSYTMHNANPYDTAAYPFYVIQKSFLNCSYYGQTDSIIHVRVRWPAVQFAAVDSQTYTGATIQLINQSHDDSYIWYFDPTCSVLIDTATNLSVHYQTPGDKTITLIGNTIQHCIGDTNVKHIFVGNPVNRDSIGVTCLDLDIDTTTYISEGILAYHVDRYGNSYTGGYTFSSSFNGANYNTATYAYLRKTDKNGNLVWNKSIPRAQTYDYQYYSSYITGITSDPAGNIYICGSFGTEDYFQFDSLIVYEQSGSNNTNFFTAKFDSAGHGQWMVSSALNEPGTPDYIGATDIKYADDNHIYISITASLASFFDCYVNFAGSLSIQRLWSLNVMQIDGNGNFIKNNCAASIRLGSYNPSLDLGNIYGVFNPSNAAFVTVRTGVTGPKLFVHNDCSVSVLGYFYDSLSFGNNMSQRDSVDLRHNTGIKGYGDITSAFLANLDPVSGWQNEHTLFGTTMFLPEFGTLSPSTGYGDFIPRFDFDSRKNLYITAHVDSLFFTDTTTATTVGQSPESYTMVAKFDPTGHNLWHTLNRNYTDVHHITGINLSPDESELVLTGFYSNGINLASTHNPPSLLLTHLAQAQFIAAMDTAGDVKWINSIGAGGNINNIFSQATCGGNIYTIALNNNNTHEFKYNLFGTCSASDTCAVRINCNSLSIALTAGTLPFCSGDSLTFTASPATAVPGAIYQWRVNGVNTGNNSNTLLINHPVSGQVIGCLLVQMGGDTLFSNSITITGAQITTPVISQRQDSLISTYGTSYTWYLNGNLISPGTQEIMITQNGSYTVSVRDTFGCSALSTPFIVAHLGLNSLTDPASIKVYPTPNVGYFIIETSNPSGLDMVINDVYGNQVYSQNLTSVKQNIDIHELPAGIYLVGIKTNSGYSYFKIAKQ